MEGFLDRLFVISPLAGRISEEIHEKLSKETLREIFKTIQGSLQIFSWKLLKRFLKPTLCKFLNSSMEDYIEIPEVMTDKKKQWSIFLRQS